MTLPLSPDLKNSLISTAQAFREGDEAVALRYFHSASAQDPQVANQIYRQLWEVMHCPNIVDFGRHALWNQNGQTAPLSKKTQAVEDVLKMLIEQAGTPNSPSLPAGVKPVIMPAFFDCGLDPRFSFDGNYLLPSLKNGFSLNSFRRTISEWIAYLEFFLRAHLSLNPEERALRQMILAVSKVENAWTKSTQFTFTEQYEAIQSVFVEQREFLEKASGLYQMLHLNPNAPARLYPCELLVPLHHINKPQSESDKKNATVPGKENGDLSRCARWGYWRLRKEMYDVYNPSRRRELLDLHDLHYVPHYIFTNATGKPADNLKAALREYRAELASIVIDQKCARSFQACKEKLLPKLEAFHIAWNRHTDSHELLKEVNEVFSRMDPYKTSHDYKKWKMEMSNLPCFADLYMQYVMRFYDSSHYWENRYDHEAYDSLKKIVLRDFPQSHNARLLRAHANAIGT